MKILLVNVDSKFNLAIRRMYNYFINNENDVEMVDLKFSGYPHNQIKIIDGSKYDHIYISNIFEINKYRVIVENCRNVNYGGIGSRSPFEKLPLEIENTPPYYFSYEDTAYGFITRGCIRKCWFCKVPIYEGNLQVYNNVKNVVGSFKKAVFLDNNILAYEKHLDVFQWLIDHKIKCNFNQGLDFRLTNNENLELLSNLKYMGAYTFAFDDLAYMNMLESKLSLLKYWLDKPWIIRFYIYYHPSMNLHDLVNRVEWCRKNECLPYVMRDLDCWKSDNKHFLIDYAAYCNQPSMFKKLTFEEFLNIREISDKRRENDLVVFKSLTQ